MGHVRWETPEIGIGARTARCGPCYSIWGGGGGVKVRARRGAWRTLGAVHAHGVADGGGEGTCFSPDGAARPQTAGTALEACGGQGGGGLQM